MNTCTFTLFRTRSAHKLRVFQQGMGNVAEQHEEFKTSQHITSHHVAHGDQKTGNVTIRLSALKHILFHQHNPITCFCNADMLIISYGIQSSMLVFCKFKGWLCYNKNTSSNGLQCRRTFKGWHKVSRNNASYQTVTSSLPSHFSQLKWHNACFWLFLRCFYATFFS